MDRVKERIRRKMKTGELNPEALKLIEGEIYTMIFLERLDATKKTRAVKRRMRLVKCYRHHAVFESPAGIQQSFRYWDIKKLLAGEPR